MAKTGVLIECNHVVCDNVIADDARFQLQRLHTAGVAVVVITQSAQQQAQAQWESLAADLPVIPIYGLTAEAPPTWLWPKPAQLLRACSEQDIDIFNSWVIGSSHDLFRAAAQAGFLGGIYIGDDMPDEKFGLQVCNQADSLADAPRVMIPPQGGCWHEQ